MKQEKIVAITLIMFLSLGSCTTSDEFLSETNPNTITINEFWETEEDFEKGLMAAYNSLQSDFVMGGGAVSSLHTLSDIAKPNPWGQDNIDLHEYNATNVNDFTTNMWTELYTGIFRANQVLENLENADLPESFKTEIETEARFLRGLYYFWLATTYNDGEIIIHTSVPENMDEFSQPLSPRNEVYALIFSDLQFAQENLPETRSAINLGRATWGAATSILGKVYLYEEMFEEARIEFKKVIDSGLYHLAPDISWNFDIAHEHNPESIFEVNFSDVVKPGETPNNATTRAADYAPQEAGGDRNVEPAYNLIQKYKEDVLDPEDPRNSGQQYSQRALASIVFKGDGQMFYQRSTQEFDFGVEQEAHVKKFQNWWLTEEPVDNRSGINERVVRLADVYLMYAEAVLKTSGNVSEAIQYVNLVRDRSGLLELSPEEYNSEELMHHLMYIERPLELSFEGHGIRWQDIRRWGIVEEILAELSQISYRSFPNDLREATAEDLADPNAVIVRQFVQSYGNYDSAEDDFLPIPYQETITNDEIQE
ncbi:RagB/SusD family nutrient uptake outer membrane protein [Salegentibacter sp. F188]|uniref:RagB/SusD family nutrient uptake outer membrane protein n=1 Tax=Autumnicola patrickiae TaxID=3075591 RepID=A0ABU3DZF6_9FLAO|nr:RagB/SusD family nutrient uptake outer membrane protein [Salegentibacter sp. F188]MDT0689087.1 RagB/SusD family nutrient uptake outer membrane protein [Salegentibacter sp. F188]